jgi:hypothetical protein
MRLVELDAGRWLVELGDGLGLEIILLFSQTVAFWRWRGELVAEVTVGEG